MTRPKTWLARRALAGTLAVLALSSACSGRDYGTDDLVDIGTDIEPSAVGPRGDRRAKRTRSPEPTVIPTSRGKIVIRVRDRKDRPRPGVTVAFTSPTGARTAQVVSDGKGIARAAATPGDWRVHIPTGCVGRMMVSFGGSARVGVAPGQTSRGDLTVEATRRWMPGPPVRWDADPPWAPQQDVTLRFRIIVRVNIVAVVQETDAHRHIPASLILVVSGVHVHRIGMNRQAGAVSDVLFYFVAAIFQLIFP